MLRAITPPRVIFAAAASSGIAIYFLSFQLASRALRR